MLALPADAPTGSGSSAVAVDAAWADDAATEPARAPATRDMTPTMATRRKDRRWVEGRGEIRLIERPFVETTSSTGTLTHSVYKATDMDESGGGRCES